MATNSPSTSLASQSAIGRYRIEKILGNGAFGITYLARDVMLERSVAIKEFFPISMARRANNGTDVIELPHISPEKFAREREHFLREAKIVARVSHPSIVRIIDFIEANNTTYIVMDYIEGRSLADQIATTGLYTPPLARNLLSQLLPAVEALHGQGVIHGDIKPDNILIQKNGAPVLIDFGSAIAKDSSSYNRMTPGYAALEQYPGQSDKPGPWTDIYAIGAVLYACLTGKTPPAAPERSKSAWSPAPTNAGSWGNLEITLRAALELRVADRPQSVGQLTLLATGKSPRTFPSLPHSVPIAILAISGLLLVAYIAWQSQMPKPRNVVPAVTATPKPPPPPTPAADPKFDEADYAAAQKVDTPDAYSLYLLNHPRGKYVEKVKALQRRQP